MAKLAVIKQGEAKTLTLTITDEDTGEAVDLSGATLYLVVKRQKSDTTPILARLDAALGKGQAAVGIVTFAITKTESNIEPGPLYGELRMTWPGGPESIDKTKDFQIFIDTAVAAL